MTARLPLFHRPRYRRIRWGAFAEQCAQRAVANGRVYITAVRALDRIRNADHRSANDHA